MIPINRPVAEEACATHDPTVTGAAFWLLPIF